tara:strand:- start:247 stop:849 length:603 start_codon:yes stop_codon:yes gene_type:complete
MKLINKKTIIFLSLLIFCIQSWTKADNVRNFEIEGFSIEDSLLNYMSYDEIKKEINRDNNYYYKNKLYVSILSSQKIYENLEIYDDLSFIIKSKNDSKFFIKGIEAQLKIDKNISECYKKQRVIANDIQEYFQELNINEIKYDIEKSELEGSKDKSVRYIDMPLPDEAGEFRVACHEREDKNLLFVIINSKEFMNALHNF